MFNSNLYVSLSGGEETQSFEYSEWNFSILEYSFKLIAIYRPPYSAAHPVLPGKFFEEFSNYLEDIVLCPEILMITGDFNFHLDDTETLVHALFVTSHVDYCNALLAGIPQYQVQRIQRVLNAAARLIHPCSRFSHITPVLRSLHWLPVKFRVEFKIALLVYKALNNIAPIYISEMLIPKQSSDRWTLRSDGLLHIPKTNCKTLGDRAFAYAAPQLWNSLPLDIRNCENISVFKKRLKTFLFSIRPITLDRLRPCWILSLLL